MRDQPKSSNDPTQRQNSKGIRPKQIAGDLDLEPSYLRQLLRDYGWKHKPGRFWTFTESEARQVKEIITERLQRDGRGKR
jgi:hypothetical protein